MMKKLVLVILALFGAVFMVLLIGGLGLFALTYLEAFPETGWDSSFGDSLPPPDIPSGEPADLDWMVSRLDGENVSVAELADGKVLFLNFWATWCPPCIVEMPSIQELYSDYKEEVIFACVSDEQLETIEEFVEEEGYDFPVYRGGDTIAESFVTQGIPATFILRSDATVALKHVGGADWSHETVRNFIDSLLTNDSEAIVAGN